MTTGNRLPHWAGPPLQAAMMSGFMSLLVSGVATYKAIGQTPDFSARWLNAWFLAWPIAFTTLLVVAPVTRRIVGSVVQSPPPAGDRQSAPRTSA